ncbi:hypothetical protein [Sphingobacterium deserti]|uniref:Uncharacterized protein n=1 Tax=Sphingobacterium deserti TaxID=1229276 RepID=A0A0B8T8I4_9SPHI|nr:hypothetical protein [Sphingobacterium deserti]KGE14235.1 hypothetical protein DI53_2065 [Sphingobacterium deserti]
MKKISLKNLGKDQILTSDELKLIMGGTIDSEDGYEDGYSTFKCKCYNSGIVWEAKYKNTSDMVNYIDGSCSNGGECNAV